MGVRRIASRQRFFSEIVLSNFRDREVGIDEMRNAYEAAGFWTNEDEERGLREWKNAELRRRARMPIVDEDGEIMIDEDGKPAEIVNIRRGRAGSDERQNVFIFIDHATKEDLEFLIEDRIKTKNYVESEIRRYLGVYRRRYGIRATRRFQRRLNFGGSPSDN